MTTAEKDTQDYWIAQIRKVDIGKLVAHLTRLKGGANPGVSFADVSKYLSQLARLAVAPSTVGGIKGQYWGEKSIRALLGVLGDDWCVITYSYVDGKFPLLWASIPNTSDNRLKARVIISKLLRLFPMEGITVTQSEPKEHKPRSEEHTGGSVTYYEVEVLNPTKEGRESYTAECNDLIESLHLTPAEANVFKALWRTAADRMGKGKKGNDAIYDAEKMVFFSQRILAVTKFAAESKAN